VSGTKTLLLRQSKPSCPSSNLLTPSRDGFSGGYVMDGSSVRATRILWSSRLSSSMGVGFMRVSWSCLALAPVETCRFRKTGHRLELDEGVSAPLE